MERVTLTHAEVITLARDTKDTVRENKNERGTLLTFKVRTRVNDRVANSPCIYRTCTFSADSQEAVDNLKEIVKEGATLKIEGRTDKYNSKKAQAWVEVIRASDIIEVAPQQAEEQQTPEEPRKEKLPF